MYHNKLINFYFSLIFTSLIIFPFSCKDHPDSPIVLINPPKINPIIIGDTTDMVVTKQNENASVGFKFGESAYNLDIDGNGENDVKFFGSRNELRGLGTWYNVKINCNSSNIKLLSYPYTDTIFVSYDTTKIKQDGVLKIEYSKSYICQKKDKKDVFVSLKGPNLIALREKDSLKENSHFANSYFEIRRKYASNPINYLLYYKSKDTVIYKMTSYIYGCHYFPGDDTTYVGFEMQIGDKVKLGWIKISIRYGHETQIIETALQK